MQDLQQQLRKVVSEKKTQAAAYEQQLLQKEARIVSLAGEEAKLQHNLNEMMANLRHKQVQMATLMSEHQRTTHGLNIELIVLESKNRIYEVALENAMVIMQAHEDTRAALLASVEKLETATMMMEVEAQRLQQGAEIVTGTHNGGPFTYTSANFCLRELNIVHCARCPQCDTSPISFMGSRTHRDETHT